MGSQQSTLNGKHLHEPENGERGGKTTNISSLLKRLKRDDESILVDTLQELQKQENDDSLFLRYNDFIASIDEKIEESSPPPAVLTTIARISLCPHHRIAIHSLETLFKVVQRGPPALTLLPSPIFSSSSPYQLYSGLSFLTALTKKLQTVFSEIQTILPTDPSHLQKFTKLTNDDRFIIELSIDFCYTSFSIPKLLLDENPLIEVDSEIIQDLILFVKEAIPTILKTVSTIDTLITSLPSDSSPTTPLISDDDTEIIDYLKELRDEFEDFVSDGWDFFHSLTFRIAGPLKSAFQTIVLDDPSFPDLILNSLKYPHGDIREITFTTITNVVQKFEWMKIKFMTANLVGRMFETVDLVSLPLSESRTLSELTDFIDSMCDPIGDDDETAFEQYPRIRASVFEPAKPLIIFIFNNSDKLILSEKDNAHHERRLCWIHSSIRDMELRSEEHDADIVSALVKWEIQTMVEMENEVNFSRFFKKMRNQTSEWNEDKPDLQKRREVLLREEGWDDAFELRVVGIEKDSTQVIQDNARQFRVELTLNTDELE
ncbi:hypothetical protein BLNAU_6819 [Blattamonas nauphoetae]|uniref:Uncharacterized protein n=1 Tax=Blattamonas nauphoetae TaxID=2049346 RepID=A0ABQ9Y317_9EUKA|nr:hypothetical protein BLNAU_6819 [Blattamonas nauphoetae]